MDINELIIKDLKSLSSEKLKAFSAKLVPSVAVENVLGVSVPNVKALAQKYADNEHIDGFLNNLPHKYLEENTLHGFIICKEKDFEKATAYLNAFLPYADNWASVDGMRPVAFKKDLKRAREYILSLLDSPAVYAKRFAIVCAITYFLGDDFDEALADKIVAIDSEEYYVNMAIAWYLATALAKNEGYALAVLASGRLKNEVQNAAIKKAQESFRVSQGIKESLKNLKRR